MRWCRIIMQKSYADIIQWCYNQLHTLSNWNCLFLFEKPSSFNWHISRSKNRRLSCSDPLLTDSEQRPHCMHSARALYLVVICAISSLFNSPSTSGCWSIDILYTKIYHWNSDGSSTSPQNRRSRNIFVMWQAYFFVVLCCKSSPMISRCDCLRVVKRNLHLPLGVPHVSASSMNQSMTRMTPFLVHHIWD